MNSSTDNVANDPEDQNGQKRSGKISVWLKRIGIAGFLFFLIKGILWLTVGAAVLRYVGCEG